MNDEPREPDEDAEEMGEEAGLTDGSWWVETYDEVGNTYRTPQPYVNLRKQVIEAWKAGIKDETITKPKLTDELLDYIAEKEFAAHVGGERNRRSHRLIIDAQYILDAIPEEGAYVDPLLSQVHRVGDRTDAPLRYWTVEMWLTWSDGRFGKAESAMAAAAEAVRLRQKMVAAIRDAKVTYTGELPGSGATP